MAPAFLCWVSVGSSASTVKSVEGKGREKKRREEKRREQRRAKEKAREQNRREEKSTTLQAQKNKLKCIPPFGIAQELQNGRQSDKHSDMSQTLNIKPERSIVGKMRG